ncbi:unnamed protein product [Vitrella brassicaformis CCMP3155]|uniref:GDT1 family protein n=2 Tax=Vitrella brassicaformis TaxID=1169539 RepID=A0A0G4ET18_VITBC|nr:unnamed protein product [Vitrella brassicaformis CCMP3155]|eukprot:CEM01561.1 unnamed protein product [Vitrella brassicaformis CCMP3155]
MLISRLSVFLSFVFIFIAAPSGDAQDAADLASDAALLLRGLKGLHHDDGNASTPAAGLHPSLVDSAWNQIQGVFEGMASSAGEGQQSHAGFWTAFAASLLNIIFSEIGDKTFFIAAILSMRGSHIIVFWAAFACLALMTLLSALLGKLLPTLLPKIWTHYAAIVLFFVFAVKSFYDACMNTFEEPEEEIRELEQEMNLDAASEDATPLSDHHLISNNNHSNDMTMPITSFPQGFRLLPSEPSGPEPSEPHAQTHNHSHSHSHPTHTARAKYDPSLPSTAVPSPFSETALPDSNEDEGGGGEDKHVGSSVGNSNSNHHLHMRSQQSQRSQQQSTAAESSDALDRPFSSIADEGSSHASPPTSTSTSQHDHSNQLPPTAAAPPPDLNTPLVQQQEPAHTDTDTDTDGAGQGQGATYGYVPSPPLDFVRHTSTASSRLGGVGGVPGRLRRRVRGTWVERWGLSWIVNKTFWQAFMMTFCAEWGDRSQITTIALAAKLEETVGVTVGGCLGHAICTGIAVVGGKMLAASISERAVALAAGTLFLVFAVGSLLLGPNVV